MKRCMCAAASVFLMAASANGADYFRYKLHKIDGVYYSLSDELIYGVTGKVDTLDLAACVCCAEPKVMEVVDTINTRKTSAYHFHAPARRYMTQGWYAGDVVIADTIEYNGRVYPVTGIDLSAFATSDNLTSVTLPNTISWLDNYAFEGCTSLTSVELPSSLRKLGYHSFYNTGLQELQLPDSIAEINDPGVKMKFPDNPPIYDYGYSPRFLEHSLFTKGNISDDVFLMTKGRFCLQNYSMSCEFSTLIIPEVDRFYCNVESIFQNDLSTVVSMSVEPPVIDEPNGWYYCDPGNSFTDSEWKTFNYMDDVGKKNLPASGLLADYSGVELVVPAGSEELYRNADHWRNFAVIRGVESFDEYLNPLASTGITERDSDVSVTSTGEGVCVTSTEAVGVEVFTPAGATVFRGEVCGEKRISLPAGIYLVRTDRSVTKVKV